MGTHFEQIPEAIQHHIQEVTKSSGLPFSDESVDLIAEAWLEKRNLFDEQTRLLHMEEIDSLAQESDRAAIMLTYSGSLVALGVPRDGRRWAEYASIGLRKDVPAVASAEHAMVAGELIRGRGVEFIEGPIKKSSPLLKIAVCGEEVSPADQDTRIREATIFLTNGFVKINRTLIITDEKLPDQFTLKSMVAYLAAKNGMTQKKTKQLIDDYAALIEAGIILGERVPLGKLGKLLLRLRPPQKPRVGRNPATGAEMTIRAKPAMYVPAFSASRSLKQKAKGVRVP
jgi:nucleoid DNA-binding protein